MRAYYGVAPKPAHMTAALATPCAPREGAATPRRRSAPLPGHERGGSGLTRVHGGLAVLLQGELRRTALALKAYRSQARPQVVAEDAADAVGGVGKGQARGPELKARRRRTG
jgi:hypothetical protein